MSAAKRWLDETRKNTALAKELEFVKGMLETYRRIALARQSTTALTRKLYEAQQRNERLVRRCERLEKANAEAWGRMHAYIFENAQLRHTGECLEAALVRARRPMPTAEDIEDAIRDAILVDAELLIDVDDMVKRITKLIGGEE